MPDSNKLRDPLSSLSPNSAGKANATCKQKNRVIRQPYKPLGPRIDHAGEPLLPWRDSVFEVTSLRVFELFWDSEVIDVLVSGTNAYAKEKGAGGRREGERVAGASLAPGLPRPWGRPWRKVTESEMRVFLALLISMGAKRECGSSGYWRRGAGKEVFQAMSLKRFGQIKRYLHISDPKMQLSRAEWFKKLEPLNTMIQTRCQKYYFPASNVTVDEMMIRFGGRSFHTYRMPSKPIKEGYKVFALCDVGYTYSWIFASRSDSFAGLVLQKDLTPTGSTVFQLACNLPYTSGCHFNIYMDNYFASQQLMIRLRALGIGACGTARVNGFAFPPDLQDERKTIPWNEVCSGSADPDGKVLALQWQDNRVVHFLSTIHSPEERIISERKKPRQSSSNGPAIRRVFGHHERANVPIPAITDDYNHYKVGVDVADQYRSYYFTQLKCLRNWPPIFYWLLDTTVINCYLLLRRLSSSSHIPHLGSSRLFRESLAKSIIAMYGQKQKRARTSYYIRETTPPRFSLHQHHTSLPPPSGDQSQHKYASLGGPRLECAECRFTLRGMKQKGRRARRSRHGCAGPGCGFSLCHNCFDIRHKKLPT